MHVFTDTTVIYSGMFDGQPKERGSRQNIVRAHRNPVRSSPPRTLSPSESSDISIKDEKEQKKAKQNNTASSPHSKQKELSKTSV